MGLYHGSGAYSPASNRRGSTLNSMPVHLGFMVDKVKEALGQVFCHIILFSAVHIVPSVFLIHIHSFINHQCHVIVEIVSIIKQHTKKDSM
jgi:hypothetical protein